MILILRWWLVLEVLGILALPLTIWVFRWLPGRGIAWSKAVGILVVGYGAWLLAMLGLAPFGVGAGVVAAIVLAGFSWLTLRRTSRAQIGAALRAHWMRWLAYEAVFGVALAAGLWLRFNGALGSAIQSTEKPMELMLLQAMTTSPSFPPQDLWLAGYGVNYYYLGYIFVTLLQTLSGVSVGVAFNLGVATIFALTAVGVAGLLDALTGLADRSAERVPNGRVRWGRVAAALLAVVLVLGIGNQLGVLQRIVGSSQVNQLSDGQRLRVLVQAIQGVAPRTLDPATVKAPLDSATLKPMEKFDWWAPSRAIWDGVGPATITVDGVQRQGEQQFEVITEFPYFSFYLGDMHPHVLALPWNILVLALALMLVARPSAMYRHDWPELLIHALALGSLYMLNSWDAPTFGAIYVGGLALLTHRLWPNGGRAVWRHFAVHLLALGGLALLLYAPFLLTFDSFAGQPNVPEPWGSIPIIRTLGRTIGPALDHTSLSDLLIIFGVFLVPLLAWWSRWIIGWRAWLIVGGAFALGLLLSAPLLLFAPLALLLIQAAWHNADSPSRALILLIGSIAALLLIGTDVFYLRDHFDKRLNTIFKVYYQIWLLFGIATAYAIWALLRDGHWRRWTTAAWSVPFGVLLVGTLVYPISTWSPQTTGRWAEPPHVLDGLAYSTYAPAEARAAADWLRANSVPTARIVSYPGSSYGNGGEIASLSGRATLLAWPGSHEGLWRAKQPAAAAQIGARSSDIVTIYTSSDATQVRDLLASYQVKYIVLGPNERAAYPDATFQTLDQIATRVYDANGWAILQVK